MWVATVPISKVFYRYGSPSVLAYVREEAARLRAGAPDAVRQTTAEVLARYGEDGNMVAAMAVANWSLQELVAALKALPRLAPRKPRKRRSRAASPEPRKKNPSDPLGPPGPATLPTPDQPPRPGDSGGGAESYPGTPPTPEPP